VVQLLSRNFGQDDTTNPVEANSCYLVLLESDGGMPLSSWPSDKIKTIDASVEVTIAVTDLQVCGQESTFCQKISKHCLPSIQILF